MFNTTTFAKKVGISSSTVRNWEKHFSHWLTNDYKSGKTFTASGLQQFMVIKYLIQERGFTIEGAKKEITRQENLGEEHQKVLGKLKKLRTFLVHLKKELD